MQVWLFFNVDGFTKSTIRKIYSNTFKYMDEYKIEYCLLFAWCCVCTPMFRVLCYFAKVEKKVYRMQRNTISQTVNFFLLIIMFCCQNNYTIINDHYRSARREVFLKNVLPIKCHLAIIFQKWLATRINFSIICIF